MEWIIFYETKAKRNVTATCRHFFISRKTFYKWFNRFDERNLRTLEDQDKAPKNTRKKEITSLEEDRIVALRKQYLVWGKLKLQKLYQNIYQEKISSWKIQYIIKRYKLYLNLVKNEKLQRKRKRITELKRKPFPGFLIALDVITIYWNGLKRYILTAIDTISKIAFARMYTTKSSRSAADFLKRLFYLLDGSFLNGLHDNDSAFYKEFQRACEDLGISQYWSRPRTPTDNPVCENFNGILKREFLRFGNFHPDPVIFNKGLTEWLIVYDFIRSHQALGYDIPWQFYQKTAKVLPMSSSSANT
ncbi:MAG: DDE-type integrase/transposase/recombinase [Thermodesulfobacteriota bacterium]